MLKYIMPILLLVACSPSEAAKPGETPITNTSAPVSPTSVITDTPSPAAILEQIPSPTVTLEQTTAVRTSPVITTIPVKAIAAGGGHSVALLENGDVLGWGQQRVFGLSADPDMVQPLPTLLPTVHNIKAIYARATHVLFIDQAGTIHESNFLKLGEGSVFTDIDHVQQVTTGGDTLLALKEDGSVWAWGAGQYGQLGTGQLVDTTNFVEVPIDHVTQVLLRDAMALAVREDGTLWAWGSSPTVTGFDEMWSTPRQVQIVQNVQSMAEGDGISILHRDGTVTQWVEGVFQPVTGLPPIIQIDGMKDFYGLGVGADGTVWAWGQLWSVATYPDPRPTAEAWGLERFRGFQVNINDIVQVSADAEVILALDHHGTVWAWGFSGIGNIGTGIDEGLVRTPTPIIITNP